MGYRCRLAIFPKVTTQLRDLSASRLLICWVKCKNLLLFFIDNFFSGCKDPTTPIRTPLRCKLSCKSSSLQEHSVNKPDGNSTAVFFPCISFSLRALFLLFEIILQRFYQLTQQQSPLCRNSCSSKNTVLPGQRILITVLVILFIVTLNN